MDELRQEEELSELCEDVRSSIYMPWQGEVPERAEGARCCTGPRSRQREMRKPSRRATSGLTQLDKLKEQMESRGGGARESGILWHLTRGCRQGGVESVCQVLIPHLLCCRSWLL